MIKNKKNNKAALKHASNIQIPQPLEDSGAFASDPVGLLKKKKNLRKN